MSDELQGNYESEHQPEDHEVCAPVEPARPATLWPVSICFWLTLLLAALIYGSVFLAPKLAVWNRLRFEYEQNAARLVELDNEVEYLERVEDTLRTDPDFLRRLSENSHLINDGELIPVSGNLLFGVDDQEQKSERPASAPPLQWLIERLAADRSLRSGLLALTATLVVFAFTFLNDAGTGLVSDAGVIIRRLFTLPAGRYRVAAHRVAGRSDTDEE